MEARKNVPWVVPVAGGLGAAFGTILWPLIGGQPFAPSMLFGGAVTGVVTAVVSWIVLGFLARRRP